MSVTTSRLDDAGPTGAADAVVASSSASVETRWSWFVAFASLGVMSVSFGAPFVSVVALKPIAAELGSARSVPALASALAWLGMAVGGLLMGRLAERVGVRWTVLFGALMIGLGLYISSRGDAWALFIGHGVFIGLLGNAGINAPLYVYVTRWFDRRRGTALALISSGQYVAGAIWPTIFERGIAALGWRHTMLLFIAVEIAVVVPLALIFLRPAAEGPKLSSGSVGPGSGEPVLGLRPRTAQALLSAAGFCCCVPMAMPPNHLVAFCSDLGITPTRGAAMLSLLLGTAFVSRQFWGLVADRIGGLRTLLAGSACQTAALCAFLFTQDEIGLFAVSAVFGFGFSGMIPCYVLAIRELFPAAEAGWRVPALLLLSGSGMAAGAWLAGALYDVFGFYAPAFLAGIAFSAANLVIIGGLTARQRRKGMLRPFR